MRALLLVFILSGCVTTTKDCPSVEQEPVSQCRAKAACHIGSAGSVFGAMLSGAGAGAHGRNLAIQQQNDCMDRDLDTQTYNAGFEKPVRIKCESTTYNDGTETNCRQN